MKFKYGHPPNVVVELESPELVPSPSENKMAAFGGGIGVFITLVFMWLFWEEVGPNLKIVIKEQPPLMYIFGLFATLALHELIHVVCFPKAFTGNNSIIGILPNTGLMYAWCGYTMSRERYLFTLAGPLLFLSVIPLVLFAFFPSYLRDILPYALFNLACFGGDAIGFYIVLTKVPAFSKVQLNGLEFYYNKP